MVRMERRVRAEVREPSGGLSEWGKECGGELDLIGPTQ